jgi:hypothetical protein
MGPGHWASLMLCVRALPAGWAVATAKARNGLSEFTLAHGPDSQAVIVRLTAACTTSGATQRPSDQPGARRYEWADARSGQLTWYTIFAGGCITAQLHPASNTTAFAGEASSALGFTSRHNLQQTLRRALQTGDSTSTRSQHDDRPHRTNSRPRPGGCPAGATAKVAGAR